MTYRDKSSRRVIVSAALVIGLCLVPAAARAAAFVHKGMTISHFRDEFILLNAGVNTLSTANTSAGGDPMMVLMDLDHRPLVSGDDEAGYPNAQITYNVPTRGYFHVIIYAYTDFSGTTDLVLNGAVQSSGFFGGATTCPSLPVARYRVSTAAPPGGVLDSVILTRRGQTVTAWDDDSGVGVQSQIDVIDASVECIVVGAWATDLSGKHDLYVNDAATVGADRDGDGLGHALEALLGTCDTSDQPGCANVPVLRDTDRDGLSDFAEVFGKDDGVFPQPLPFWGANPLHKDVFVEIDYNLQSGTNPFTAAFAQAVRDYYAAGTAGDLANPDGAPGIAVHLDMGQDPTNQADLTLFGNWGGSGPTTETDYHRSADNDRAVVRRNLFHHALATEGCCGGQAPAGDHLYWGIAPGFNLNSVTFAHELGHNLNLAHFGHTSWGAMNCKPSYYSIMNYLYQFTGGAKFSQGTLPALDPSSVTETAPFPDGSLSFLTGYYSYSPQTRWIDWNRDGDSFGANARAAVAWSPANGCEIRRSNTQDQLGIGAGATATKTPRLAMFGARNTLYAFWIEPMGLTSVVKYSYSSATTTTQNGSCPGGDALGNTCSTWSTPATLPSQAQGAQEVAVMPSEDSTVRVAIRKSGAITLFTGSVSSGDAIANWSSGVSIPGVTAASAGPAIANITDGATDKVAVFFVEPVNGVSTHRYSITPYGTVSFGQKLTVQDDAVPARIAQGSITPGVTSFALQGCATATCTNRSTCGAFPDSQGRIKFWCHVPSHEQTIAWRDMSSEAFSDGFSDSERTTLDPPALAVHVTRAPAGDPVRGTFASGQIYMVTTNTTNENPRSPRLWISDVVDSGRGPFALPVNFRRINRGYVQGSADGVKAFSGFSLFENTRLGALKAANVHWSTGLAVLPLFDGSVRVSLKDGHDFQVMERGSCLALNPAAGCGPVNQWGF